MRTRHPLNQAMQHLPVLVILAILGIGWSLGTPAPASPAVPTTGLQDVASSPASISPAPRPNWVDLANPALSQRLGITPRHQAEIARIDTELDRKAEQTVCIEIQHWQRRGGFHVEPLPNFRDPASPYGSPLRALKRKAEDQIAAVLSADEKDRCQRELRLLSPGPKVKMVRRLHPATLKMD
jgi:hypothetical protein